MIPTAFIAMAESGGPVMALRRNQDGSTFQNDLMSLGDGSLSGSVRCGLGSKSTLAPARLRQQGPSGQLCDAGQRPLRQVIAALPKVGLKVGALRNMGRVRPDGGAELGRARRDGIDRLQCNTPFSSTSSPRRLTRPRTRHPHSTQAVAHGNPDPATVVHVFEILKMDLPVYRA